MHYVSLGLIQVTVTVLCFAVNMTDTILLHYLNRMCVIRYFEAKWNLKIVSNKCLYVDMYVVMLLVLLTKDWLWRNTDNKQVCFGFTSCVRWQRGTARICCCAPPRRGCCWPLAPWPRSNRSISPGYLARSSNRQRPDGTDRRTDARQMHWPCSAYYAGSANRERKCAENYNK